MKNFLFLIFLSMTCISVFSQTDSTIQLPLKDDKIFYEQVIQLDSSIKKDRIYLAVKQWFAETFKDSKSVIQVDDKEGGKVLGKFIDVIVVNNNGYFVSNEKNFTINVDIKDSKYRVQVYDCYYHFVVNAPIQKEDKTESYDNEYKEYLNLINTENDKSNKKKKIKEAIESDGKSLSNLNQLINKLITSLKKSVSENVSSSF